MKTSLLLPMTLLLLTSCTERDEENDCTKKPSWANCVTAKEASSEGKLTVQVTVNEQNPSVVIKLYSGSSVETGSLKITDTLTDVSKTYLLSEGEYSGEAFYTVIHNGQQKKLTVPNSSKLRMKKRTYCEGECLEPDNEVLQLTIPK